MRIFEDFLEGYEEFDKKAAPPGIAPFVTIQRRGLMSLNRVAFEAMGSPEAVTLLFHSEKRSIAIRPAHPTNPRAYPIRPQTSGGTRLLAGTAFSKRHDIDTRVARRYQVEVRDKILLIDLDQDAPEVTGPRAREFNQPRVNLRSAGDTQILPRSGDVVKQ